MIPIININAPMIIEIKENNETVSTNDRKNEKVLLLYEEFMKELK
jgi:hypothetical protein